MRPLNFINGGEISLFLLHESQVWGSHGNKWVDDCELKATVENQTHETLENCQNIYSLLDRFQYILGNHYSELEEIKTLFKNNFS
jgi:hypothetical protein